MGPRIINSLKLITFDATGTLVQFRKPPVQVYMDFAGRHGIGTEAEKMKASFRKQWKDLNSTQPHFGSWKSWWTQFVIQTYKDSGIKDVDEATLNKIAAELIDHFRTSDCWEVKPGAMDLLSELKRLSTVRVGVVSNFDPRLRQILRAVGISEFIEFCILSHEEQMSKPSKQIFLKAVEVSKIDHSNSRDACFHIGDNYELDFIGATSAGFRAALLVPPESIDDTLKKMPANTVFTSLSQFRNYLFTE